MRKILLSLALLLQASLVFAVRPPSGGSSTASDVDCTGCVGSADIENDSIDGAQIKDLLTWDVATTIDGASTTFVHTAEFSDGIRSSTGNFLTSLGVSSATPVSTLGVTGTIRASGSITSQSDLFVSGDIGIRTATPDTINGASPFNSGDTVNIQGTSSSGFQANLTVNGYSNSYLAFTTQNGSANNRLWLFGNAATDGLMTVTAFSDAGASPAAALQLQRTGQTGISDGDGTIPGLHFITDTDLGMRRVRANEMAFVSATNDYMRVTSTGVWVSTTGATIGKHRIGTMEGYGSSVSSGTTLLVQYSSVTVTGDLVVDFTDLGLKDYSAAPHFIFLQVQRDSDDDSVLDCTYHSASSTGFTIEISSCSGDGAVSACGADASARTVNFQLVGPTP